MMGKVLLSVNVLKNMGVSIETHEGGFRVVGSVPPEAQKYLAILNQNPEEARQVLERHQEAPPAAAPSTLPSAPVSADASPPDSAEEGSPDSVGEINPREEFALGYLTHLEMLLEDENDPDWLAFAFWSLVNTAMNGFARRGLEDWDDLRVYVSDQVGYRELQIRSLRSWAGAYRAREQARLRGEDSPDLAEREELWAYRAWLVEIARANPGATTIWELNPWLDLSGWRRLLAQKGREWGLFWR